MEPVPCTRCWAQTSTIEYSVKKRLVSFRMILFKQTFDPLKSGLCHNFITVRISQMRHAFFILQTNQLNKFTEIIFVLYEHYTVGQDSSVGIATRYGLDGLGIQCWCVRDFLNTSTSALGPPSLLYNGVLRRGKAAGAWR
jgi:hypothetical protein